MSYISEQYNNIKKSSLISDITILTGGTTIAQVITIGFSPIITRIYGPEAFGVMGVFIALIALIMPMASLNYAHAIVLPASGNDARTLLNLSLFIAICIAALLLVILGVFHNQIANLIQLHTSSLYLLLLPPIVILIAAEQAFSQWLVRMKQFCSISVSVIARDATVNIFKVGIGIMIATAPVLIIINLVGHAIHAAILWLQAKHSIRRYRTYTEVSRNEYWQSIKSIALTYRDYPLYRAPQGLLNTLTLNIPVLILAAFFGPFSAGFYVLVRRVLKLPSSLIALSVGKALLPRITEAAQSGDSIRPLIIKATGGLALVGLVPYGVVIILGPWLFGSIFGDEWIAAGEYAQWLALWLFFVFICIPCIQSIPIIGLQAHFLLYEIMSISIRTGALAFGALVLKSDIDAVALYSITGTILYVGLIIWVLIKSKDRVRENFK